MHANQSYVGKPVSRVDGVAKVTGTAKYAAEYHVDGLLHSYIINSTITRGKIKRIDSSVALALPGVVDFFYHGNRPSLPWFDLKYMDMDAPPGSPFRPFYDNNIKFNGQPIGLIVAESFEVARYAAALVLVEYEEEDLFETDIVDQLDKARKPKAGILNALKPLPPQPKGDFEKAYHASPVRIDEKFLHGQEHHNPLELFASTVIYEGNGKLTVYDKTQGVINSQLYIANVFGLRYKDVRVVSPFVGGAFGSGLRPNYQLFLAVLASLELKRSVRVTMNRHQMFTFGHRPATVQQMQYGANADGTLNAIYHGAYGETSRFEDYTEVVVNWSNRLYPAPNVTLEYKLIPLDLFTPMDMRAPGGSTASQAIEVAMDQLAHELKMDPVQLRLLNYAEKDPELGKPFTSKALKACYLEGAEKFGWSKRSMEPRSVKRGKSLVGMGMATGIWDSLQLMARAEAVLNKDGRLEVRSATADIGTGTYTIMTQIAADELGIPIEDVMFSLGDSKMPFAPFQGGSMTAVTVGVAVKTACRELKKKIWKKAKSAEGSVFKDTSFEEVRFQKGRIVLTGGSFISMSYREVIAGNKGKPIKSTNTATPAMLKLKKYSKAVHSASFVEVEVDEDFGTITVTRALTAVAAGKIINPKTARSQIIGSMVWGISKALREESIIDHRYGRFINTNLAEYHIPVHADIPDLDVLFVKEVDTVINELGAKGVGEIAMVSMPPAVANAVFNATGKRINKFPILLDKLL
jgi:xanthine dehydrogenase YagR molybdenum-binding subunit